MSAQISVIIAAYNAAETIETAIQSVAEQRCAALELIVVDDGSTDDTRAVLERLRVPGMKVIAQSNAGPSAARNRALAVASGQFIASLDADDIWLADKIRRQRAALLTRTDAAVAYGWTDVVDDELQFVHPDRRARHEGDVYGRLLQENFIVSGSNTLIRRSALDRVGGYDEQLRAVEDWELHVRLAAQFAFVNVPAVVVRYRKSPRSLSSDLALMEASFLTARAKVFAAAPTHYRALQGRCSASFYRYLAARSMQSGHLTRRPRQTLAYLFTALRQHPGGGWRILGALNPWGPLRLALRRQANQPRERLRALAGWWRNMFFSKR